MLKQAAKGAGQVKVRWLEQLANGLYYPSTKEWEESEGALSKVRTQKCCTKGDYHTCYKLLHFAAQSRLWSCKTRFQLQSMGCPL